MDTHCSGGFEATSTWASMSLQFMARCYVALVYCIERLACVLGAQSV